MNNSSQTKNLLLLKATGVKIKISLEIKIEIEAKEEIMANNSKTLDNKTNLIKDSSPDISLKTTIPLALNKIKGNAKVMIIRNSDTYYYLLYN